MALFWFAGLALLATVLTLVAVFFFTTRISADVQNMADDLAKKFEKTFNMRPEIRVDGLVIIEASTPVLELATASRKILVRHRWTQTWLYSTKVLEVEAPFTAKAGFVLKEPFRLRIDPHTKIVTADLTAPEILSTEMGEIKILTDEDGLWNKLTPSDREEALRALRAQADKQFAESPILHEARQEAESRIRQILEPGKYPAKPPIEVQN